MHKHEQGAPREGPNWEGQVVKRVLRQVSMAISEAEAGLTRVEERYSVAPMKVLLDIKTVPDNNLVARISLKPTAGFSSLMQEWHGFLQQYHQVGLAGHEAYSKAPCW